VDIAVVGAGTVGAATGFGLQSKRHEVIFSDIDERILENLRARGYGTGTVEDAARQADIIMVCVPTPTFSGHFILSNVLDACAQIGRALRDSPSYKVVVIRSTVIPFSTRSSAIPILEKESQRKAGLDFGVCMNPEFLRESTALEDFLLPDRIVIGQLDKHSGDLLESVYEPFGRPVLRCSLEEAELSKYVANGFLACKISYFNEVHNICKKLGADSKVVSLAVSLDRRIGSYGTEGGRPFDGKCLPKDVEAFLKSISELGENFEVLSAAEKVNRRDLPKIVAEVRHG
jgi:UDPglucose 6-dehydrogenase